MSVSFDPTMRERVEQQLRNEGVTRSVDSVIAQFEYERRMAEQLRKASPAERRLLYKQAYNELFAMFPDHPELAADINNRKLRASRIFDKISNFINENVVFLDIGAGDCLLSYIVAQHAKWVYALEVTEQKLELSDRPPNFSLVLFDGFEFPLPNESINVAFSHQVLEHLHPDDARLHLREVFRVLRPDGCYICVTPHRFAGPHDISKYFSREPLGLHLKEYTYNDIMKLFKSEGFKDVKVFIKRHLLPISFVSALESILSVLPYLIRKKLFMKSISLASISIVARKST
ncbi:MAG: class I SAM-dependent methyltransferase [Armatimonadota bacterium]